MFYATNEQVLEALCNMTVLQLVDLVAGLQKEYNLKESDMQPKVVVQKTEIPKVEEKTEFDVVLVSAGENRMGVIKLLRSITSASLLEAKSLADPGKVIKTAISSEEAESIRKQLEEVGAKVEIK